MFHLGRKRSFSVFNISPVAYIRSHIKQKSDAAIQPTESRQDSFSFVDVLPEFADGLLHIEGFSHIILLVHFDRAGKTQLVRPTFLDDTPHGIFASRHPARPNNIGISVVELVERRQNTLVVRADDLLDGTPVADIKPYIRRFDAFPQASLGWTQNLEMRPKPEGRE